MNQRFRYNLQYFMTAVSMSLGAVQGANAQSVDLDRTVNALVQELGPISVTRQIYQPFYLKNENPDLCNSAPKIRCKSVTGSDGPAQDCVPDPTWLKCNTPQDRTVNITAEQILSATNAHVAKINEISVSAATRSEVVGNVTAWAGDIINCSKTPGTVSVNINKTIPHIASIKVDRDIQTSVPISAHFATNVPGFGDIKTTLTMGPSATSGRVAYDGPPISDVRSASGTVTVGAHAKMTASFVVWPVQSTLPFSLTVTADADLSANDKGWHKLSDVVQENDRTFPIDGMVTLTQASAGSLKFIAGQFDPDTCTDDKMITKPMALSASGAFVVE